MNRRRQPSLFDDRDALPAPQPKLVELARGLPPTIRFGTSTWTYDGWAGDVYHRDYRGPQPAQRLEEYARYPLFGLLRLLREAAEPLRARLVQWLDAELGAQVLLVDLPQL